MYYAKLISCQAKIIYGMNHKYLIYIYIILRKTKFINKKV